MKIGRFLITAKKQSRPLPGEIVTALSRVDEVVTMVEARLTAMEANVKETRQRLETIYRKVYRDAEKGDGAKELGIIEPLKSGDSRPLIIRPGDSFM